MEHFPYQDRLRLSFLGTSQSDNNTSEHPGEGLILPVDANPRPIARLDGTWRRPRVAGYDAPFSREKSESITLHFDGRPSYIRGQSAKPLFHDNASYWDGDQPTASVKVPNNRVNIKVLSQRGNDMRIRVWSRD